MRLLTPRVVRLLRTLIIAVIVVYALHYILPAVSAAVYLIRLILSGAPTQPPKPPPSPPVKPSLEYADPYNYTVVSPLLPRGVSTFPPDDFTKHLVLMTTSKSDIRWLKTLPPISGLDQIMYHADGPLMDVPVNKGNEAMAYLTYLIEYYDTLPDIVVFIHDHAQAWHNNGLQGDRTAVMLGELNWRRVNHRGYMNLRCNWRPGCPDWMQPKRDKSEYSEWKMEESVLAEAFMQLFDTRYDQVPDVIGVPCCAQFAVSRELVRKHAKEDYVKWREWLVKTPITDKYSGRVLEYLWHWIFTGEEVACPREHVCYCDGYGICFGSEEEFERYRTFEQETETMERRLKLAEERGPEPGEDLGRRERGMKELGRKLREDREEMKGMLNVARLLGRHEEVRRRDVGEEQFTPI